MTFIPHHLFHINCTNKLNGVDDFLLKLGRQKNVMGMWVVMQQKHFCVIKFRIYRIIIMKGYNPNPNRLLLLSSLNHWKFWWRSFNFSLYMCVVFFSCCIKSTSISAAASSAIYLVDFLSDSKEELNYWFGQLGIICYPSICLCLFWNYLIVSRLNCLLISLLLLRIFSLHKWYCPVIFSIAFHFNYYIVKSISPSFITFIPHHLFCLKRINKLNGVDYFSFWIG